MLRFNFPHNFLLMMAERYLKWPNLLSRVCKTPGKFHHKHKKMQAKMQSSLTRFFKNVHLDHSYTGIIVFPVKSNNLDLPKKTFVLIYTYSYFRQMEKFQIQKVVQLCVTVLAYLQNFKSNNFI